MRTSRTHPKLSAYNVLEGVHDFNKVPFAPPGSKPTIFNPLEIRGSGDHLGQGHWTHGTLNQHLIIINVGNSPFHQQAEFVPRCAIELVDAIKKLTAEEEVRPRR